MNARAYVVLVLGDPTVNRVRLSVLGGMASENVKNKNPVSRFKTNAAKNKPIVSKI